MSEKSKKFIKKLKEIIKKCNAYSNKENLETITYDEMQYLYSFEDIINNVKIAFLSNEFKNADTYNIMDFAKKNNTIYNFLDFTKISVIEKYSKYIKEDFKQEFENKLAEGKKEFSSKKDYLEDLLLKSNKDAFKKYQKEAFELFKKKIFKNVDIDSVEKLEKYIDNLENEGINVDDLLPNNILYETLEEKIKKSEKHPLEVEINDLIKSSTNTDDINLLNEINSKITIAEEPYLSDSSVCAEKLGHINDTKYLKNFINDAYTNKININNYMHIDGKLHYSSNDPKTQYDEINKAEKINIKINENIINDFIDITTEIQNIENNGNALSSYLEAKKNVIEAVENGNIEKIKEVYKEFKEIDGKIQKVFNKLDEMSKNDLFPGNMSFSRESNAPVDFRTNFKTATRYRIISQFNKLCSECEINPKDFFKNPVESIKNVYKHYQKNGEISTYLKTNNVIDAAKSLIDTSEEHTNMFQANPNYLESNTEKLLSNIIMSFAGLVDDKTRNNLVSAFQFASISARSGKDTIDNLINSSPIEQVSKLFLLEQEDRTLFNISSNNKLIDLETGNAKLPFDINDYIKENHTTKDRIALRLYNASLENFDNIKDVDQKDNLIKSIRMAATEALKIKKLDRDTKQLLTNIKKGEFNKNLNKKVEYKMHAIEIRESLKEGKLDENSIKNEIKKLIDNKKDYESRGLFNRIFQGETRALSNSNNIIENSLKDYCGDNYNVLYNEVLNSKTESKIDKTIKENMIIPEKDIESKIDTKTNDLKIETDLENFKETTKEASK